MNIINGLDKSNDTWLYDLHTIHQKGAIYPQSIAFTNLQKRKGAAFHYYYDCAGNFRLKSGEDIPNRQDNFWDKDFEKKMINAIYKDFTIQDTTTLNFKQITLSSNQSQNLNLSSQNIHCISKGKAELQDHYNEDSTKLFDYEYFFRGFTKRNIRDLWKASSDGRIGYVWTMQTLSDVFTEIDPFADEPEEPKRDPKFGDSTVSAFSLLSLTNPFAQRIFLNNDMHKGSCKNSSNNNIDKNLAHFKFDTLSRGFFSGGSIWDSDFNRPSAKNAKDYPKLLGETAYNGIKESVLKNCYVMLPTILGFEFHRLDKCDGQINGTNCNNTQNQSSQDEPNGLVLPLYFQ